MMASADVFYVVFSGLCLLARESEGGKTFKTYVLVENATQTAFDTKGIQIPVHHPVVFVSQDKPDATKPSVSYTDIDMQEYLGQANATSYIATVTRLFPGSVALQGAAPGAAPSIDTKDMIDLSALPLGGSPRFGKVIPSALKPGARSHAVFVFQGNVKIARGALARYQDIDGTPVLFGLVGQTGGDNQFGKDQAGKEKRLPVAESFVVEVPYEQNKELILPGETPDSPIKIPTRKDMVVHVRNLPFDSLVVPHTHGDGPDTHFERFYDLMLGDPGERPVPTPYYEDFRKAPAHHDKGSVGTRNLGKPRCSFATALY
jgi:hypothetical protein